MSIFKKAKESGLALITSSKQGTESAEKGDWVVNFPAPEGIKKIPMTIPNLANFLHEQGIIVRYNRMTHETEIVGRGDPHEENALNNAISRIISDCTANHIGGLDKIPVFLDAIAVANSYHPVLDWIKSQPWDNVDRLPELFNTIETPETGRRDKYLRRWMIGAVRMMQNDGDEESHGVVVFQSREGTHKSRWIKKLFGTHQHRWILDGFYLQPSDKDSVKRYASYAIVEMGELDTTFGSADLGALKAFFTKPFDVVRVPYAKKDTYLPRRTSAIATVNEKFFLRDKGLNRRYWVIPVTMLNENHGLDMQQVWAQVLHLASLGKEAEPHWLTDEEVLEHGVYTQQFTVPCPYTDRMQVMLEINVPIEEWTDFKTMSEIYMEVMNTTSERLNRGDLSRFSTAYYKLFPEAVNKTKITRGVRKVARPPLVVKFAY